MVTPYYQDQNITLYHGDCIDLADTWTAADTLVTDPPYGIKWVSGVSSYKGNTRSSSAQPPIANDDSLEIRDKVLEIWGSKPAAVFGTWRKPAPARVKHRLIWWKQGQAPGPAHCAFMLQDEEIYILGDGWRKSSPPMRSVIATSESRSVTARQIGHPTPKPVELMEKLVDRAPGVIADPFAGSGSTLVAAQNLGRKAIGVEMEERYCEIIANRLSSPVLV